MTSLPSISYSSWMAWRNGCRWRWKLDKLEERRSKDFGVHMDFGTTIHRAIELSHSRQHSMSLEASVRYFERAFRLMSRWHMSSYREHEQKNFDLRFFLDAGKRILERLGECEELAKSQVVYNEFKLDGPIDRTDDVQVNFKGYVDMVIKSTDARGNAILYVCDFKTCSWGWDRQKRQDRELHFQLMLYKHFLCKRFGLDPKGVRTAFVLLKKRPRPGDAPVEFFPISAGPVSVQRALDEMNKDITAQAEAVSTGKFQKDRKMCTSKYGDTCPYLGTTHCPD